MPCVFFCAGFLILASFVELLKSVNAESVPKWTDYSGASSSLSSDYILPVTLHAGEYGYFIDSSVKEVISIQYQADTFFDDTEPDAVDSHYRFIGWSYSEDVVEVDLVSGAGIVDADHDNLYAVWSDKANITYFATPGYFEKQGEQYPAVMTAYEYGAHFIEETPLRDDEQYRFGGWYTGAQGSGEHYTTETTVTEPYLNVYAFWIPNDEHVDNFIINQDYHADNIPTLGRIWTLRRNSICGVIGWFRNVRFRFLKS